MKHITILTVAFLFISSISTAAPTENLRSLQIKKMICSWLKSDIKDQNPSLNFNRNSCLEGSFVVTKKTFNKKLNKVTTLDLKYQIKNKTYTLKGLAQVYRIASTTKTGKLSFKWALRDVKFNLSDKRSWRVQLEKIFDSFHAGYGDSSYKKVPSSYNMKMLIKDLSESLESYGDPENDSEYDYCVYESENNTKFAMEYLKDHNTGELYNFLKKMIQKGLVKGIIYRGYDDGASEYCSQYYFRVLTKDSYVIYLNADFGT